MRRSSGAENLRRPGLVALGVVCASLACPLADAFGGSLPRLRAAGLAVVVPGGGNPFEAAPVRRYLASRLGSIDAAVYDAQSGATYCYRPTLREDTASIIKVDILATLLAEAQSAHRGLSEEEAALATRMIEESDNDAADALWDEEGGAAAVSRFDTRVGMVATTPDEAGHWGLTTTTACDQVALLRAIAYPNGLLTRASRTYELGLMAQVQSDQRWGIPAGVPAGVNADVKNGWLPVGSGWQINSDGDVSGDGESYVASVMTAGDPSESYGIETIDELSKLIWHAMRPSSAAGRTMEGWH